MARTAATKGSRKPGAAKSGVRTPRTATDDPRADPVVAMRIRDLLYDYAHCIDDDRLEAWPDFFVDDCSYRIIPKENLDRDPPFAIVYLENRNQLRDRVRIIREALVYSLRYDRRIVGNVRVDHRQDGLYPVRATYIAVTTDVVDGVTKLFSAGKYEARIALTDDGPRFKDLDVIVDTYSVDRQVALPL